MARKSRKGQDASSRASRRIGPTRLGTGAATRNTVLHGDGVYREVSATGGGPHATDHENGGTDEINVGGLSGTLADPQTPVTHASRHENAGDDEIDVTGLSGVLTDPQTPVLHAARHENGGDDEIDVTGLSGLLADEQDPLDHATDHQAGGGDPIKLDDLATPDNNTDLDANTSTHGLLPKLPAANSGTVFQGDGTWAYSSVFPGDVMFGKGSDGSLTLVANTTLTNSAATVFEFFYTTIDLSTFTLSQHSSDNVVFLHASTSITSNGGTISFIPTDTGIAGGAGAGGGGAGGASGESGYYYRCYAKEFLGSGTVQANGGNGTNGADATAASATANGAAGANATNLGSFRGNSIAITGSITAGGGGQSAGTGGTAGSGTLSVLDYNQSLIRDPQFLFFSDVWNNVSSSGIHLTTPVPSDGAGAGGRNNGGAQGGGGGGSSGSGVGFFATSVAGSAGGGGGAGGSGAGGGGGGAGGPGSCLAVICRKTTATWTFKAHGGNGGNGGAGNGFGGGGAGGPGGGGGWVKVAVSYGSPTPTVTATGGTKGNKGVHGAGGGNDGNDGNNGNPGLAELYVY